MFQWVNYSIIHTTNTPNSTLEKLAIYQGFRRSRNKRTVTTVKKVGEVGAANAPSVLVTWTNVLRLLEPSTDDLAAYGVDPL
jgi:hypothetical protein